MDPSARSAFEQFSCDFVTSNNLSNAPFVSLIRKYKIPISVSMSILSVVILRTIRISNQLLFGIHICSYFIYTHCAVFSSISIALGRLFSAL